MFRYLDILEVQTANTNLDSMYIIPVRLSSKDMIFLILLILLII